MTRTDSDRPTARSPVAPGIRRQETTLNPVMMVPRTTRRIAWLAVLLLAVWGAALVTAAVSDQVELKATHQAGVPVH